MADVLQFVVQHHNTGTSVHWDFMLEQTDALATWQVPIPPEMITNAPLAIKRIADHPSRFLTCQGPLRHHPGSVRIHDRGTYATLAKSPTVWRISIAGWHLVGTFQLDRIADAGPDAWHIARIAE